MAAKADHMHGTMDALILRAVAAGPRHGYGIARWLEAESGDVLEIEEGSLYPALYRLEQRGWLKSEWGTSELGRRAKFYRLTRAGATALKRETEQWQRFAGAVSRVLLPGAT